MKRKLIVTLVASALELYAASAGAQAAGCNIIGGASSSTAATPVRTGPLNPINGFPEYVTDSTGLSVQRCLDPVFCFASPVIPTDPFSIQIGSGVEAFYWGATNTVFNAAGNRILTYVAAAETAFLQAGPNGEPIDGAQFPFLRLRFTMGVPVDGTYTVVHPYGTNTFPVTGATGTRDVFFTIDKGLVSSSTITGPVAPFMRADPRFSIVPVGFLGDGGVAAAPVPALGSPCGDFVQVSGVDNRGRPVDFGVGETVLFSDLFGIQGAIFDGKTQTPVSPTRVSYSRSLAGAGQIDSFASTTATAAVSVVDGPTIPLGTGRIPLPVTLDRTALSATAGVDSTSVVVLNAAAVPPIVAMTAVDPTAIDPITLLPKPTDATTLNVHLVDFVDIAAADYDPASGTLAVTASSADLRLSPALTLRDYGAFTAGVPTKLVTTIAPPAVVHVDSAAGGTSVAQVRVIAATPPSAPIGLTSTAQTSLTVTLSWTDTSANETSFNIYTVSVGGIRTLVGSVGANVTTATVTNLTAGTVYTFQVDAANAVGAAGSNTFTVGTLALPAAPSAVTPTLGTATRTINVSWADNSLDETGFLVERATALAGPYTNLTTVGAGVTSYIDSGGALLTGNAATYFYRVTAVRGPDSSTVAQSAGLATPAAAQSALGLTATATSGTNVNLAWTNRAGATSNQIFRSAGAAAFTLLTTVGATAATFSDTTVTAGTSYRYRVDAVNWAGSTQSAVSAAVVPQVTAVLVAPTGLTASAATNPALNWVDQSTGETAYRVRRTAYTVGTTGTVTVGAVTTLSSTVASAAAPATGGARTFTDAGGVVNATVLYDVAALSGATVGPLATVFDVAGGMQTANRPTATATPATARVTVTWTAPGTTAMQASIGGYEVQRCTGLTCTNFVKVPGAAVNTAGTVDGRGTLTFVDNTVARRTGYTYRLRTVGGKGTGLVGAFSPTRTVSTN